MMMMVQLKHSITKIVTKILTITIVIKSNIYDNTQVGNTFRNCIDHHQQTSCSR